MQRSLAEILFEDMRLIVDVGKKVLASSLLVFG